MSIKRPNLLKLAAKWRDRLGLNQWAIKIDYCAPKEMQNEGAVGEVNWDAVRRTAIIRVLEPGHIDDKQFATVRDIENTVVHEMVHCVIGPIIKNKADYIRKENVVDDLTNALVKADRGEA
jgi:hypothetical protein